MAPSRKSFSAKFKTEVLKYITDKGCSNSAAARHFGTDEKNIRRWKTQSGSLHAVIKNEFSKAKQLPGSGRRLFPFSENTSRISRFKSRPNNSFLIKKISRGLFSRKYGI